MEIFLEKVAADLFEKHGENIHQLTVVFPNKRAGFFFTIYLNQQLKQPLLSPEITSISQFFSELSHRFVPEKLNLSLRLYKVYRDISGSVESFDDFYYWGGMLISDFDQVDKYFVNAHDLFTNITDLKEIERRFSVFEPENRIYLENFWKTVLTEDRKPNQEEFVRLWKDLASIYHQFKGSLDKEGLAYEGMLYRSVVEEILEGRKIIPEDKHFVFAGFNALNKCEEEIFSFLSSKGKASFYWDYDSYYVSDKDQEAGLFMRQNLGKYNQADHSFTFNNLTFSKKKMKITGISSQVGQAQVAGEELHRIFNSKENISSVDTAVVLCDEELLLPVISALPPQAAKVNITMGFPLRLTPVFSLLNNLADLQKYSRIEENETKFYSKNVLSVLNNQLIFSLFAKESRELSAYIKTNNIIYISGAEFSQYPDLALFFFSPETIAELLDYFLKILKMLFLLWEKKEAGIKSELFREYLYNAYLQVNKLKDNLVHKGSEILGGEDFLSFNTFFRILYQYLNELTIPFEAESVEGVQIMGILETRTLDFKNLIFLSMNDGIMPKVNHSGSFIPYNLRRIFGLPTIDEQNAIYAYYFYRLLQRAEDITFVYNSGSDGLFTGEKSRYLYQLQMESPAVVPESDVVYKIERTTGSFVSINKDEKVLGSLYKYLKGEKILSPSALEKYLTCSLQFYFRYVAELKEPDEMTEDIDSRIFGNLFHKSMENIYKPYIGKILEKEIIEKLILDNESVERNILEAFRLEYFNGLNSHVKEQITGKNLLTYEILKKYILRVLELDKNRAPFKIEGLEIPVISVIQVNKSGNISLGGYIDRLDRENGSLRILDYKTGKAESDFDRMDSLFDRGSKKRNKTAFQTLVYSFILNKNMPSEAFIFPGTYILRNIFDEKYSVGFKCKQNGNREVEFISVASDFEAKLSSLLDEIFDPAVPFERTEVEDNCAYCLYKNLCNNI